MRWAGLIVVAGMLIGAAVTRPGDADAVLIKDIPFEKQKPDYCGEACAGRWLKHLGLTWTQDEVFELTGVDPKLGRGCWSEELGPALKRIGFAVGEVWYPLKRDDMPALEKQWQAVLADLKNGVPTIVVMQYSRQDDEAHMRLVLGYDPAADEVIFHDPSPKNGAYTRMKRKLFLKIWAVEEKESWMVERIRLEGTKIAGPEVLKAK